MYNAIRHRRRRAGFTLMELLLVMAILVILLGLVAPRFMNTQAKANINAAKSQIGLFKTPLEMYFQNMNAYPTTEQGLLAIAEAPADLENKDKWDGPYIDGGIPKDPWGHDYQYRYPAEKNKNDFPDIWSLGPDGEDGSDDDIGNWPADVEGETTEAT
ncbi:MAG: type II secretion system major pseudopilin GspG [Pirellulales bacterium]|nr:type II secretion system major pseudopilin GspG [Pirellulales bacterium]